MTRGRRLRHIAAARIGSDEERRPSASCCRRAGWRRGTTEPTAAAASPADSRSTRSDRRQHDHQADARCHHPDETGAAEREHTGIGEQRRSRGDRGDGEHGHRDRDLERHVFAVAPPQPCVDHDAARARSPGTHRRPGWRATSAERRPRRPRSIAARRPSSATRPNASPSANGSRPTARLTAVPTANQHAAIAPTVPKRRWSRSANAAAAITLLAMPTTIGPNHEASGG